MTDILKNNPGLAAQFEKQTGFSLRDFSQGKDGGSIKKFKTEADARNAGFGSGDRVNIDGVNGTLD